MKMEQIKCSETSAYKIQTPGNYPEESIQHSEHGESLKSRNCNCFAWMVECNCLNSCQDLKNESIFSGIMLKNNDPLVEEIT